MSEVQRRPSKNRFAWFASKDKSIQQASGKLAKSNSKRVPVSGPRRLASASVEVLDVKQPVNRNSGALSAPGSPALPQAAKPPWAVVKKPASEYEFERPPAWSQKPGEWSSPTAPRAPQYHVHEPQGPKWYINHHLRPPYSIQPPVLFRSTASSSQTHSHNSSSSGPKQPRVYTDDVDSLDVSDPHGQRWHHTSPYDLGRAAAATLRPRSQFVGPGVGTFAGPIEGSEPIETTYTATASSLPVPPPTSSRVGSRSRNSSYSRIAPSPLSQSTSADDLGSKSLQSTLTPGAPISLDDPINPPFSNSTTNSSTSSFTALHLIPPRARSASPLKATTQQPTSEPELTALNEVSPPEILRISTAGTSGSVDAGETENEHTSSISGVNRRRSVSATLPMPVREASSRLLRASNLGATPPLTTPSPISGRPSQKPPTIKLPTNLLTKVPSADRPEKRGSVLGRLVKRFSSSRRPGTSNIGGTPYHSQPSTREATPLIEESTNTTPQPHSPSIIVNDSPSLAPISNLPNESTIETLIQIHAAEDNSAPRNSGEIQGPQLPPPQLFSPLSFNSALNRSSVSLNPAEQEHRIGLIIANPDESPIPSPLKPAALLPDSVIPAPRPPRSAAPISRPLTAVTAISGLELHEYPPHSDSHASYYAFSSERPQSSSPREIVSRSSNLSSSIPAGQFDVGEKRSSRELRERRGSRASPERSSRVVEQFRPPSTVGTPRQSDSPTKRQSTLRDVSSSEQDLDRHRRSRRPREGSSPSRGGRSDRDRGDREREREHERETDRERQHRKERERTRRSEERARERERDREREDRIRDREASRSPTKPSSRSHGERDREPRSPAPVLSTVIAPLNLRDKDKSSHRNVERRSSRDRSSRTLSTPPDSAPVLQSPILPSRHRRRQPSTETISALGKEWEIVPDDSASQRHVARERERRRSATERQGSSARSSSAQDYVLPGVKSLKTPRRSLSADSSLTSKSRKAPSKPPTPPPKSFTKPPTTGPLSVRRRSVTPPPRRASPAPTPKSSSQKLVISGPTPIGKSRSRKGSNASLSQRPSSPPRSQQSTPPAGQKQRSTASRPTNADSRRSSSRSHHPKSVSTDELPMSRDRTPPEPSDAERRRRRGSSWGASERSQAAIPPVMPTSVSYGHQTSGVAPGDVARMGSAHTSYSLQAPIAVTGRTFPLSPPQPTGQVYTAKDFYGRAVQYYSTSTVPIQPPYSTNSPYGLSSGIPPTANNILPPGYPASSSLTNLDHAYPQQPSDPDTYVQFSPRANYPIAPFTHTSSPNWSPYSPPH